MDFKHEIIAFKDRGDKNYVDENVSKHGNANEQRAKAEIEKACSLAV